MKTRKKELSAILGWQKRKRKKRRRRRRSKSRANPNPLCGAQYALLQSKSNVFGNDLSHITTDQTDRRTLLLSYMDLLKRSKNSLDHAVDHYKRMYNLYTILHGSDCSNVTLSCWFEWSNELTDRSFFSDARMHLKTRKKRLLVRRSEEEKMKWKQAAWYHFSSEAAVQACTSRHHLFPPLLFTTLSLLLSFIPFLP